MSSATQSSDNFPMSGDYRVGPDGRLIQPEPPRTPKLPTAAKNHTQFGAQAFARYWLKTVEYAWNSGDTQPLRDISDESCEFCSSLIEQVKHYYEEGNWATGFNYRTTQVDDFVKHPSEDGCLAGLLYYTDHSAPYYQNEALKHKGEDRYILELHICETPESWTTRRGGAFDDDRH